MKVGILIKLLEIERNSRIDKNNPSSRYIYRAYNNVIAHIRESYSSNENMTLVKINALDITDGMKEKIKILTKKKLPKEKESLLDTLVKNIGIGKKKAQDLINEGLKNVNDLKKKKWFDKLPKETQLMIKTSPLRKIKNSDIKKLEKIFIKCKSYETIFVGSYRRNKSYSRDIDIMLVSNNKEDLVNYINYIKKKLDDIIVYSSGKDKISFVFKTLETKGKYYKADVFRTPKKYKAGMLLYSTGSKEFNIKMRYKAKLKGYILNQYGLYDRKNKTHYNIKSEKGIFKKLNMEYLEPDKR